jgi:hypothetical protein
MAPTTHLWKLERLDFDMASILLFNCNYEEFMKKLLYLGVFEG